MDFISCAYNDRFKSIKIKVFGAFQSTYFQREKISSVNKN